MNASDTADDGLPERSVFRTMALPPRRRRSLLGRVAKAVRGYAGMGVFLAMVSVSAAMVVLSR